MKHARVPCYALIAGLVSTLVAMGCATALATPVASNRPHAGSSPVLAAARALARRLGTTSHPFVGNQPTGTTRGWTAWFPRDIKPESLGPANVPSRHLDLIGPALFVGPQGARGEFHYYNPGSVEQRGDTYRGASLTRSHAIHLAYAWMHAIGAPVPRGSPYVQVRSGMTVIGGTGLCCYRSLAVLSWNGKRDSFGNVRSAADMIYVADAGTVVEADIGPLMTPSGYGFSHPCPGQTHRDTTGIVVGSWCFAYASAVRTMIIGDIGGHSSWVDNPAYLAEIDAASLNRQGHNPKYIGPRRRLIFSPQRAVYVQAYKGVPYRMTFVPAFPGLIGSIWELVRVQRAR